MENPFLARLRSQTGVTDDDLASLDAACGATWIVGDHTDIAPPGDRPGSVHILLEGWAAQYRLLPDGRRQFSALLVPGDICNLDGFMLRRVHAGVYALTNSTLAILPHAPLRDLVDAHPAIRDAFWWLLCVANALSAEWSISLGRRSTDERTAHLLCELLFRLRTVGLTYRDSYALPLTQAELGEALGMSSVHVNRTLQNLRRRGMISLQHHRLTIHDVDALGAVGGFKADYLHLDGLDTNRTTAPDERHR